MRARSRWLCFLAGEGSASLILVRPTTAIPSLLLTLCLLPDGQARAERGFVVSAGGDALVAIPEAPDSVEESPQTDPSFGYFGRLSWETAVPAYTGAERGYRWAFGIDPDVEFGRARQVGGGQSSTMAAGLRLSALFRQPFGSQRPWWFLSGAARRPGDE
jgi:hypothetical protein